MSIFVNLEKLEEHYAAMANLFISLWNRSVALSMLNYYFGLILNLNTDFIQFDNCIAKAKKLQIL